MYAKTDGKENVYNFTLKIFVYLNLWGLQYHGLGKPHIHQRMKFMIKQGTCSLTYNVTLSEFYIQWLYRLPSQLVETLSTRITTL